MIYSRHDEALAYNGMSLRDYFAAHAPIDLTLAIAIYGSEVPPGDDMGRAAFWATWTFLRYEYADAMMSERVPDRGGLSDAC